MTERHDRAIALRRFSEDGVPAITAACQDPEIPRWTPVPSPYTEDEARWFVASVPDARAIVDAATGELLGSIGWRYLDQENGQIGYWVARAARGRGVATEALRVLLRWAIDELGAGRVQLWAEPGNVASQRVAEKAGFTRECVLRFYLNFKGERRDGVMFSLVPQDL